MTKYHHVASVILLNFDGKFILQKRDNKQGIRNPGMITTWGGAVEAGENFLQAAVREIHEETNLKPDESSFEFFGNYPRDYRIDGAQVVNHVFLIKGVNEKNLQVFEGQGYEVIDPSDNGNHALYSDFTKLLMRDYRSKN